MMLLTNIDVNKGLYNGALCKILAFNSNEI